jgi:hypothetical protein
MSYQITNIFIYPIKGLAGIELTEAQVMHRGLEHDRRMMLVDKNGLFLSQRTITEMALFKVKLVEGGYEVTYKDQVVAININNYTGNGVEVTVWDDSLTCFEVSESYSAWFSKMTGQKLRLVTMTDESNRVKELKVSPYRSEVSLADGYPFLLLGSASMDKLNTRMGKDIAIERFRANIIISTTDAHEEDEPMDLATKNGVQFRVIKPCARCQVVNIDPKNATVSKEVLSELSKYRKEGNKVNFGANMIAINLGKIAVGDVLSNQSKPI